MSGNLSGTGAGYSYTAATGGNYASTYQYDANGNLKTLTRRNSAGTLLDNFTYHYNANTNQLNYVADPAGSLGDDLDNQSADNYTYDAIGQLVSDEQEEIEEIVWTVTGKVAEIRRKATSTKPDLFFTYDALGRRIRKEVRPRNGSGWVSIRDWVSTLYTYDGQGNVMAVYELKMRESGSTRTENYYISEINLYGSARLGMIKDYRHIGGRTYSTSGPGGGAPPAMTYYSWDGVPKETRGEKFFELSNHLGNVLTVITDRKLPVDDGLGTVAYYQPDVVSYSDYYPGGMMLPGRSGNSGSYRYGFQGMEGDDEVKGEGNSYTTEFRQYDPRLGKWLSIDPEARSFPWSSPYVSMSNNPISRVDPLGNSDGHYVDEDGNYLGEDGNTSDKNVYVIKKVDYNAVDNKLSTEGTKTLQDKSTPLESYTKGINISRATWDKMNNSKTDVKWLIPSVENNSDYTVYFKPEGTYGDVQNDDAYPIKPHTDLYAPIDGVSSKEIKKSAVYKVPDGNQVIVNNQGMNTDVIATDDGIGVIISFFADLIKGGWYTDAPDESWKNLEKKSE